MAMALLLAGGEPGPCALVAVGRLSTCGSVRCWCTYASWTMVG